MTRHISRRGENEGLTTLMSAVSEGNVSRVKRLIGAGENPHARDKWGRNVLYHAFAGTEMMQDTLAIFRLLGEHGVDFNSNMDTDCCTALITAITLDWPDLVQLLIDHRANVHDEGMPKFGASVSTDVAGGGEGDADNQRDEDRFIFSKGCGQYVSPLLCAAMARSYDIVDSLLTAGADCQQTSLGSFWRSSNIGACSVCDVRISPVHMAAYNGRVDLLRKLLDISRARCVEENSNTTKAISVSSNPEEDITPLWLALLRGESEAVKLLLEFDFPKAPPCHFGSGLYITLEEGRYDIARMLLLAGYDLWDDLEWIESELYPTSNSDLIEFIKDIVNKPPSLLVCSRNALRKHMGPRLSAYLSFVEVPQKVVDVILLKDVLSAASTEDVTIDV